LPSSSPESYFEAIIWRKLDESNSLSASDGERVGVRCFQPACKADAIFRQRGFWAARNPKGNTSRDRDGETGLQSAVAALEQELADLGCGLPYCRVTSAAGSREQRHAGKNPRQLLTTLPRNGKFSLL
jgi:hypothetical protein